MKCKTNYRRGGSVGGDMTKGPPPKLPPKAVPGLAVKVPVKKPKR